MAISAGAIVHNLFQAADVLIIVNKLKLNFLSIRPAGKHAASAASLSKTTCRSGEKIAEKLRKKSHALQQGRKDTGATEDNNQLTLVYV